jgi:predicted O-methyltransferase YrrM
MSSSVVHDLLDYARRRRERIQFERAKPVDCDAHSLTKSVTDTELNGLFQSEDLAHEWRAVDEEIADQHISKTGDAVNPGDRRAIYYLVRQLKPVAVLEIGTHLGGSTVHIAAALRRNQHDDPGRTYRMTTVDITNVNDPHRRPWLEYGSRHSPAEMVKRLNLTDSVSFVTRDSLEYLSASRERYDLIFLDGDHAPRAVYREIPAALNLLEDNGAILLHDYFPMLAPLWRDGAVIQGPWLAVERLRSEGAPVKAIPLGELPWRTKLGSGKTSLALLVRDLRS